MARKCEQNRSSLRHSLSSGTISVRESQLISLSSTTAAAAEATTASTTITATSRAKLSVHQLLLLAIVFVASILCNHSCECESQLKLQVTPSQRIVKTKYGSLRGSLVSFGQSRTLQPVESFLGIPYASAPVGKLRFMPPVTPAIWQGVRNVNQFGSVCPQNFPDLSNETQVLHRMTESRLKILRRFQTMLKNQSEDCLYLNIYAPTSVSRDDGRLPVLMFIHGESYEWNAGSTYDGSVLASTANLLVVTINYRLGVLGFYPSPGGSARGNFGLMDQVAALHWIQENIREFGGDERNVTVMGHGHGAACVNFLTISPMARGLFHRAVMLSGSALSPWAVASDAISHGRTVANTLGCPSEMSNSGGKPSTSAASVLDCLRHKSVEQLLSVDLRTPAHLTSFGPIVDGIVVPGEPRTLMSKPNSIFANYPLLFGITKAESYDEFTTLDERHGIDISRRDRLLRTLVRNLFQFHLQEILATIVNEYTDWTRPFFHPISLFDSLVDIFSDALVVAPTIQAGLAHAKQSRDTYFHTFEHQTENGDYPGRLGCVHGQDLAYLFGAPLINGHKLSWFSADFSRQEVALSENLIQYIANFVRFGNPNTNAGRVPKSSGSSSSDAGELYWPPYEEIQQKFLAFGLKLSVQDHYQSHRLSYWFNLLPQLHRAGGGSQEHHLLDSHNNPVTYDGIVRSGSLSAPLAFNTYYTSDSSLEMSDNTPSMGVLENSNNVTLENGGSVDDQQRSHNQSGAGHEQNAFDVIFANKGHEGNASFSMIVQSGNYSTALSLTIAIGCSLLILNVLVFAGIFYQKDRNRLETKLIRKKSHSKTKQSSGGCGETASITNQSYANNSMNLYRINSITDNYNLRNVAT